MPFEGEKFEKPSTPPEEEETEEKAEEEVEEKAEGTKEKEGEEVEEKPEEAELEKEEERLDEEQKKEMGKMEKTKKEEVKEQLTEKEVEKIAKDIKAMILPLYDKIEKLRKENPKREVGGRIINDNGKIEIELVDQSRWKEDSVTIDDSPEEARERAKKSIPFHTHPSVGGLPYESAQDILSTSVTLRKLIFHENGVTLLVSAKELPLKKIEEIDKRAWKKAREEEERCDGEIPAYWFWKAALEEKLPTYVSDLIDKKNPKRKGITIMAAR